MDQQGRELVFMHSGDFLRQNPGVSDHLNDYSSGDHAKPTMKEVDFFSTDRNGKSPSEHQEMKINIGSSSLVDSSLNTGLNLSTSSSGISIIANAKEPNDNELRVLRGELGRQHDENKKLRSLLDQITKSYKDLQAQLLVAMQKQTQGCRVEQDLVFAGMLLLNKDLSQVFCFRDHEPKPAISPSFCNRSYKKGELNDTPTPVMSAQLLMDPRPSATFDANIEPSVSYDKTHEMLISPTNIMETKSQISGKRASIADSNIDQTSQSLGSPKSPRLEEEKPNEQVPEVPFRKARVSVRARSEAPLIKR
ncbi:hypothetical protein H0E87_005175 [Populus deltoides]|uniref:Uncharacterized protein n=1 Tax=Populus deltoides TaxID=3696 RepID=A0A8T2ZJV2_POPDE|nr:hypothetical protein H0E87_005175 [Populus deltoides]